MSPRRSFSKISSRSARFRSFSARSRGVGKANFGLGASFGENGDEHRPFGAVLFLQAAAQAGGERRTRPAGRDGKGEGTAPEARHRREVARLLAVAGGRKVEQSATLAGRARHGGIDFRIVGGGDGEKRSIEIGGRERPCGFEREKSDVGSGVAQGVGLALADRAAAYDDAFFPLQIEGDGIEERPAHAKLGLYQT